VGLFDWDDRSDTPRVRLSKTWPSEGECGVRVEVVLEHLVVSATITMEEASRLTTELIGMCREAWLSQGDTAALPELVEFVDAD
jgi:hypothetical protein